MLKNKVIGTFIAIWFAVCLSYGGLRATFVAMPGWSIASAQEMTASWEDEDATPRSVAVYEREAMEELTEEPPEEPENEQEEELVEELEDEPAEEPTIEESLEGESYWYEEEDSWETEAEEVYVPSLEEYLSQFTCGSCRRNCSLANPRCFNGSQLADAKAQEYYSMF